MIVKKKHFKKWVVSKLRPLKKKKNLSNDNSIFQPLNSLLILIIKQLGLRQYLSAVQMVGTTFVTREREREMCVTSGKRGELGLGYKLRREVYVLYNAISVEKYLHWKKLSS